MYLSAISIQNFRQFGDGAAAINLSFGEGVTALVGRNDSGKTAIIDAIRYVLLTRDQDFLRVQPEDFHVDQSGAIATEILIRCTLSGLSIEEQGAFVEYLSYQDGDGVLFLTWVAKRLDGTSNSRRWVEVTVRSGRDGSGPPLEAAAREILASTYLRPLRDAEREMSPGRGSRLSQVLSNVPEIHNGDLFSNDSPPSDAAAVRGLSLLGLLDHMRHHVKTHPAVEGAQKSINDRYLSALLLAGEGLDGRIDVVDGGSESARLRQLLERLELKLFDAKGGSAMGRYGLGSNNLLYMACELLLLGREPEGLPLLLIEEPEAHLHPQRQLRLMDFLRKAAGGRIHETARKVQVILSTHSPNLASRLSLNGMVLLDGGRAFPLAKGRTKLEADDYRFLERFLDVTKANLFFANGVIVVEGDAESILLPTIARLLGSDLTEHGVSVVNVGSRGLSRYSRIFQRRDAADGPVSTPVACIADLDVLPACAPEILGLVDSETDSRWQSTSRRWKSVQDLGDEGLTREANLEARRQKLKQQDGQSVATFVSEHWTLEYDLAHAGLAKEVFVAASLASQDSAIAAGRKSRSDVELAASEEFSQLEVECDADRERLCTEIYKKFDSGNASKSIGAQYLADLLAASGCAPDFDPAAFASRIPPYIVSAIAHACRRSTVAESSRPDSDSVHA